MGAPCIPCGICPPRLAQSPTGVLPHLSQEPEPLPTIQSRCLGRGSLCWGRVHMLQGRPRPAQTGVLSRHVSLRAGSLREPHLSPAPCGEGLLGHGVGGSILRERDLVGPGSASCPRRGLPMPAHLCWSRGCPGHSSSFRGAGKVRSRLPLPGELPFQAPWSSGLPPTPTSSSSVSVPVAPRCRLWPSWFSSLVPTEILGAALACLVTPGCRQGGFFWPPRQARPCKSWLRQVACSLGGQWG